MARVRGNSMATWKKIQIHTSDGLKPAVAPVIISASRATDIPAFYGEWLVNRLKAGYVKWLNPFNHVPQYISFAEARVIIFWTKNPAPIMPLLSEFENRNIHYYFTVTLNDYETEGLEPGVPPLEDRIDTFIRLAERLGRSRVIWRFDPFILTGGADVGTLLDKVARIGNRIHNHTEQLTISFADIENYRKVQWKLAKAGIRWRALTEADMVRLAAGLEKLNAHWGLAVKTCGESVDLTAYGIAKGSCVDAGLMVRLFRHDPKLMEFLGIRSEGADLFGEPGTAEAGATDGLRWKDAGQRPQCLCAAAKDIGRYDTCPHHCLYCYANTSSAIADKNYSARTRDGESMVPG
jgi:DNA repair photolyase